MRGMAKNFEPLELTQLDAAREQLDTAIYLYFLQGSAAAVHTLVGAAQEVICGLAKRHFRKKAKELPEGILNRVVYGFRRDERNKARNFLKHPMHGNETLVLSKDENLNWIVDCITNWALMGLPFSAAMTAFIEYWYSDADLIALRKAYQEEDTQSRAQLWASAVATIPHKEATAWLGKHFAENPRGAVPIWIFSASNVVRELKRPTNRRRQVWNSKGLANDEATQPVPKSETAPYAASLAPHVVPPPMPARSSDGGHE